MVCLIKTFQKKILEDVKKIKQKTAKYYQKSLKNPNYRPFFFKFFCCCRCIQTSRALNVINYSCYLCEHRTEWAVVSINVSSCFKEIKLPNNSIASAEVSSNVFSGKLEILFKHELRIQLQIFPSSSWDLLPMDNQMPWIDTIIRYPLSSRGGGG